MGFRDRFRGHPGGPVRVCLLALLMSVALALLWVRSAKPEQKDPVELDLRKQKWSEAPVSRLKNMRAKDIVQVQIFKVEWPRGNPEARRKRIYTKRWIQYPLAMLQRKAIQGLLALVKRSPKYVRRGGGEDPASLAADRVLVVQPVRGPAFEIMYHSSMSAPLGDLYSLELKEALYSLSGGKTRVTIIRLGNRGVKDVIHTHALAPHRGVADYARSFTDTRLTRDGALLLQVRVTEAGKVVMDAEKVLRYGRAQEYPSDGPDRFVVMVHPVRW